MPSVNPASTVRIPPPRKLTSMTSRSSTHRIAAAVLAATALAPAAALADPPSSHEGVVLDPRPARAAASTLVGDPPSDHPGVRPGRSVDGPAPAPSDDETSPLLVVVLMGAGAAGLGGVVVAARRHVSDPRPVVRRS